MLSGIIVMVVHVSLCVETPRKKSELVFQGLRFLPSEALVREMAVLGRTAVYWLGEVKLLDNNARPHIEVLLDNFYKLI